MSRSPPVLCPVGGDRLQQWHTQVDLTPQGSSCRASSDSTGAGLGWRVGEEPAQLPAAGMLEGDLMKGKREEGK